METNSNIIVLTGGGTAGHITANIKLQNELKKHFSKIVYIGSKSGMEKELITKNTNYIFHEINTVKFNRKNLFANLKIPFLLHKSVKEATIILKKYKPKIIFSKGGYVGLPVVIGAHKLKIPIVCHESDLTMGLANKVAKKYANCICTNFSETAKSNGRKCHHTSSPLTLSPLTKTEAKQKLGIKSNKPVLLVTGGSLGSKKINEFIFENISELTKDYFVVHLTGKGNYNHKINVNNYKQIEFESDMPTLMRASDYAISRAGANTILELLSNKVLTIFIPLSKKVSRGDQIQNAKMVQNKKLAEIIFEEDLSIQKVQNLLNLLKNNANLIKKQIEVENFEDGTKKIIEIILQEKNT